jgi:hypothetical protein
MSHRIRLALAGVLVLGLHGGAAAQAVDISSSSDGTPGNDNSVLPAMSGTGRFVAFVSFASNLVSNDTNGERDVFLRDRDTDADGVFDEPGAVSTVRVSERAGVQANGPSSDPRITPDGRYVVFTSFAGNLIAVGQPMLGVSVILRWDRATGDIVLASQTTGGEPLLAVRSVEPSVTDDGNDVVFVYGGSMVAEVDAGHRGIVYCRDIAAGTLTQVSSVPLTDGPDFRQVNELPSISSDGATVVYLVANRWNQFHAVQGGTVYVVDRATGAVRQAYPGTQPRLSRGDPVLAFLSPFPGIPSFAQMVRIHLASGERRATGTASPGWEGSFVSPSGRYYSVVGELIDFHYASYLGFPADPTWAFDAADSTIAFPAPPPTGGPLQVRAAPLATMLDRDGDGMNDHWEGVFGLESQPPTGSIGSSGASGDPDHDGLTNAEEFARGSNPTGSHARYLAEGSSGSFFTTRVAIANPTDVQANVAVRFELAGGGTVARAVWIPGHSRVDFDSRAEGLGTSSFSTVVESTQPLVVDRLMTWGDAGGVPYGSHAETASAAPGTEWFLAEGSTVLGFQLFYLLQNPQATPTTATVRYLLPSGAPLVATYDLPARSRTTIYVNTVPGLESTDVSAAITATQPIAVERAMYRSSATQPFAIGHDAAAVASPGTSWFFGEGATGAFFDTYLLLANPSALPAAVHVDYLRDAGGPISRDYLVPANARFTVWVEGEPGMAATSFGTRVTSDVPIVAERAMYWAGGFFDYYEGHVSAGATQAGSHWLLAEGEERGAAQAATFVLIANTGSAPASVLVRTLSDGVELPVSTGPFEVAGLTRVTIPMAALPGYTHGSIEILEQGTPTGTLIVEGAIYSNAGGVPFAAGASWPATRLP